MTENVLRIEPGSLHSHEAMHHHCAGVKAFACTGCGCTLDFWGVYGPHAPGCPNRPVDPQPAKRSLRQRFADAWRELVA